MTSIMAGSCCVGFTFRRANGFEAYAEFKSIGLFDNQDEALRPIAAQTASQQHEQQPVPAKKMPASVGSAAPAKLGNEHGDSNQYSKQLQV
jgi:hypothetical protein